MVLELEIEVKLYAYLDTCTKYIDQNARTGNGKNNVAKKNVVIEISNKF